MGHIQVSHIFDVDVDNFWEKIFFNEEYNSELYTKKLAFRRYDLKDEALPNGSVNRRLITEPNTHMPGPVQKVVGETLSYEENGVYDAASRVYTFQIKPPTHQDKIDIRGKLWVEPAGEGKVTRKFEMDCSVKIFGVGKLIEKYIEKTTMESHETAAAFTNEFARTRLA